MDAALSRGLIQVIVAEFWCFVLRRLVKPRMGDQPQTYGVIRDRHLLIGPTNSSPVSENLGKSKQYQVDGCTLNTCLDLEFHHPKVPL